MRTLRNVDIAACEIQTGHMCTPPPPQQGLIYGFFKMIFDCLWVVVDVFEVVVGVVEFFEVVVDGCRSF